MPITSASIPLAPLRSHDRMLCGWRVASALPLPELLLWTGDGRSPDLTIDIGSLPKRLANATVDRPLLQVAADGTCLFSIPGVAAYLVDPTGERVVIDSVVDPLAPDVRVFLLGTVFAIICFRRNLLPLHASCIRVGNTAVALAGVSGAGKSTVAAAFGRKGYFILADDVTVVDPFAPGGPTVLPTFPRLKLWRDALERIGLSNDGMERSRPMLEKYHVPIEQDFHPAPLPLTSLVHLHVTTDHRRAEAERLSGLHSVRCVSENIYRRNLSQRLGHSRFLMASALTVSQNVSGMWKVMRQAFRKDADILASEIERILSQ